MNISYNIVYYGELDPNRDLISVKYRLGEMLNARPKQIEQILNKPPITLKKRLNIRDARRYQTAFAKAGLHTEIESVIPVLEQALYAGNDNATTSEHLVLAKKFSCPACGCKQLEALDCVRCGTVFADYRQSQYRLLKHQQDLAKQQIYDGYAKQAKTAPIVIVAPKVTHDQSHWVYAPPLLRVTGSLIDALLIAATVLVGMLLVVGFMDIIILAIALSSAQSHSIAACWELLINGALANLLIYSSFSVSQTVMLWSCFSLILLQYWGRHPETIGMRWHSIAVVDENTGAQASQKQMFIRTLSLVASTVPLGLGFLVCLSNDSNQAWHDKIAGTAVVTT